MTRSELAKRLLIAVEPRLFADALARALRTDYEIVIADVSAPAAPASEPTHFDAAIVSRQLPAGVSVERLLRLPEASSGTGFGILRTGTVERSVAVGGLAAIVSVLDDPLQPSTVGK
jgi:hypothetical protein